jgi:putative ABC transport system ATP-binding protein
MKIGWPADARNIGYVFQSFNLIPVLTAYENAELPQLLLNLSKKRRREQTMTALELVGLLIAKIIHRAN